MVGSIAVGLLLITIVYLLPVEPMRRHAAEPLNMVGASAYGSWASGVVSAGRPIFSDSIMLSEAVYEDQENRGPIACAMLNSFLVKRGNLEVADGIAIEPLVVDSNLGVVETLSKSLKGEDVDAVPMSYARYWHGHLVWLKPMLMFMNLSRILVTGMTLQFILLCVICVLIYRRLGLPYLAPFVALILFINPVTAVVSLQNAAMYMVTLTAMALMLWLYETLERRELWTVFFTILGACTTYFDFLTYPLLTLGVPLACLVCLRKVRWVRVTMLEVITLSAAWAIGYAGVWVSKWILATLLTGVDIVTPSIQSFSFRLSSSWRKLDLSYLGVVRKNLRAGYDQSLWLLFASVVVFYVWAFVRNRDHMSFSAPHFVLLTAVSLYPLAWYFVVRNHSAIHPWYGFREHGISVFALLAAVSSLMCGPKEKVSSRSFAPKHMRGTKRSVNSYRLYKRLSNSEGRD